MAFPHSLILVIPACLGLISLTRCLLHLFSWTWTMFLRPPKDLRCHYGTWALITGSTDGIGRALAFQLADHGLNLVLVSRNPSKLHLVTQQIHQKYTNVEIKNIVVDFDGGCSGEEIMRIIEEGTQGLDLGLLINNAGLAYPYARFCHEVDVGLMEGVVRVNVEGTTWVTKAVITRMLERGKPAAVINIGSGSSACLSSYPLYAIYAASKSYVDMLSKSMNLEYKQHGITVQCQIPLLVATKMASIRKTSLFIPSAETYSKASMRWIGYPHQTCIPYWPHSLQASVLRMVPESLFDWAAFSYFLGMRARGIKKDAARTSTSSHQTI